MYVLCVSSSITDQDTDPANQTEKEVLISKQVRQTESTVYQFIIYIVWEQFSYFVTLLSLHSVAVLNFDEVHLTYSCHSFFWVIYQQSLTNWSSRQSISVFSKNFKILAFTVRPGMNPFAYSCAVVSAPFFG